MDDRPGFEMLRVAEWAARTKRKWIRWHLKNQAPDATPDDINDMEQSVYEFIMRSRLKRDSRKGWFLSLIAGAVGQWLRERRQSGIPADPMDCDWDGYTSPLEVRQIRRHLAEMGYGEESWDEDF